MIENKKELAIAAHEFTVKNAGVTDSHQLGKMRHEAFDALGLPGENYEEFRAECEAVRIRYEGLAQNKFKAKVAAVVMLLIGGLFAFAGNFFHGMHIPLAHSFGLPLAFGMAWPTTGPSGSGNAATGQYAATGTGTTILWGTNNFTNITGFLTVTRISQKTIVAYDENLPNGDGLTAGNVLGIDGFSTELEVRDDTAQNTSALQVGQRILIIDGGGLAPGGARGAQYSAIIKMNGWDTAPKTAAGRTITAEKFILIT